jgi:hypothetical protein
MKETGDEKGKFLFYVFFVISFGKRDLTLVSWGMGG